MRTPSFHNWIPISSPHSLTVDKFLPLLILRSIYRWLSDQDYLWVLHGRMHLWVHVQLPVQLRWWVDNEVFDPILGYMIKCKSSIAFPLMNTVKLQNRWNIGRRIETISIVHIYECLIHRSTFLEEMVVNRNEAWELSRNWYFIRAM